MEWLRQEVNRLLVVRESWERLCGAVLEHYRGVLWRCRRLLVQPLLRQRYQELLWTDPEAAAGWAWYHWGYWEGEFNPWLWETVYGPGTVYGPRVYWGGQGP